MERTATQSNGEDYSRFAAATVGLIWLAAAGQPTSVHLNEVSLSLPSIPVKFIQADFSISIPAQCQEHFGSLKKLLPAYRAISFSSVGNGCSTAFWHDTWLPNGRLCDALPALYSHSTAPNSTIADALAWPLVAQLVPRLTRVAAAELAALEELLESFELTTSSDIRTCPLAAQDGVLRAGPLQSNNGSPV